jgi:PTH1 family peptidyl-tRNA hydrolase
MKVIVGLGNLGKKFKKTRHNLGFLVIDEFAKENRFPKFKMEKEFLAKVSEKKIGKEKIILVKPQTLMNNSGIAVKRILEKLRTSNIEPLISNLWVVHDDLDIPFEKIKISFGKSSGGHKGVESIINEIGTKDFFRFRVGIKPEKKPKNVGEFVLQEFTKKEREKLKEIIEKTIHKIKIAIEEGIEKARSKNE